MPVGTTVNGQFFLKPGSRSTLDGDALAGGGAPGRNILAVVAVCEGLEPKVPTYFTNPRALEKALPTLGPKISGLIWGPARDKKVKGQPTRVVMVRVNPAIKASLILKEGANDCLKVEAYDWGALGSQVTVEVLAATSGEGRKYVFKKGSTVETFDDVAREVWSLTHLNGAGELASLKTDVDRGADGGVTVKFVSTDAEHVAGVVTPTEIAVDGRIQIAPKGDANGDDFVITGVNKATGQLETETITHDGDADVYGPLSEKSYSSITSIAIPASAGDSINIKGDSFVLPHADFPTAKSVVDEINKQTSKGYVATLNWGKPHLITDCDEVTDEDCLDPVTGTATANVKAAVDTINQSSQLVVLTAQLATYEDIPDLLAPTYLPNGSEGVAANSDWTSAFAALKPEFCNTVVPLTQSASIHELLRLHLVYMEGDGGDERNSYVGLAPLQTKAQIDAAIVLLNNRNMTVCAQDIKVYDNKGVGTWREPEFQALQAAALQCSMRMGTPLTWKFMNVLDFRQNTAWNPVDDAEAMLGVSLFFYENSRLGQRVCRQLTSYREDHEVFNEISRNYSANESVKAVRRIQEQFIGDPDVAGLRATIQQVAVMELERQVRDKEIKDYGNVKTDEIPLGFDTTYELLALGATTFINTTAYLVREVSQ